MLRAQPRDDTQAFLRDLDEGIAYRALVAPAAVRHIPDFSRFLGYLHTKGVKSFHAVLPRADIATWAYYRSLLSGLPKPVVSGACAGLTARLGAPSGGVPSPLICAAKQLRNYEGYQEPFVFISPCAFKWSEFVRPDGVRLITHNATIRGWREHIESAGINLAQYVPQSMDSGQGLGLTVGAFGSFSAALMALMPELDCQILLGNRQALPCLLRDDWGTNHTQARFIEPYACRGGCDEGSAIGSRQHPLPALPPADQPSRESLLALFDRFDRELKLGDFLETPGIKPPRR